MSKVKIPSEISCKEETCIQKTNIALIQQSIMNIEKDLKHLSDKMDKFIDSADIKYATKFEHNQNKEKIDKIDGVLNRLNWIIITAVLAALLALIIK